MSVHQTFLAIKARSFLKSLGGRVAGGYLRNRGVSLDEAIFLLNLPKRPGLLFVGN